LIVLNVPGKEPFQPIKFPNVYANQALKLVTDN